MEAVYPLPITLGCETAALSTAAPPGVPPQVSPSPCYVALPQHGLPPDDGLTVLGVLRRYAPAYLAKYPERVSSEQRAVLTQLLNCRQPALGSHAWHCSWCGHTHINYNACNNRHCPSCGGPRRAAWLEKVLSWSLPTSYYQLIFTQPHELIPLTLANRQELYRLFFRCVGRTLKQVGRQAYHAQPGWVAVLHTWGQRMNPHIHIHVVMTAGGLSLDQQRWVTMSFDDEPLAAETLGAQLRDAYIAGLKKLFYKHELTIPPALAWITSEEDFDRWLRPFTAAPWHVRRTAPPPYARDATPALKYLARYVVGSAINDQRLVRDDGRQVTIRIKNYTTDTAETRQFSGEEFVSRFLLHVLPRHVARIRYGGLFAGCHRKRKLAICAELLPASDASLAALPDGSREDDSIVEDFDVLEESPSDNEPRSAPRCPRCLMPGMTFIGRFDRIETMRLLDDLNWFWRSVVTVIMTLPFTHSGQSRSLLAGPVSLDTLTWTSSTDDIDSHYVNNNCLPLPDT